MKNNNNKNILKFSSFTLIELIVVLAIISILVTILIATIKPTEIFKKARDNKRIADLKNIEKTMDLLYSTYPNFNELNYASTNIVYISLKDDSPTCSSYISQLPSLPPGYQYRCSANPQNIDGTGWIPIPFNNFDIINLANLPIDPINQPPYYYTFVVGGSYEVTAALEVDSNRNINGPAGTDGGTSWNVYEVGSNKKLTPLVVEDGGGRDKSLVGYWSFDEGTGTIAYDYSGNGNNGTLVNGPTWTTGKVGKALSFDGVDDYVRVTRSPSLNVINQRTVMLFLKTQPNGYHRTFIGRQGGTGQWSFNVENSGKLRWHDWVDSGIQDLLGVRTNNSNNEWHLIAVTLDTIAERKIKFYIDGVKDSEGSATLAGTPTGDLYIGSCILVAGSSWCSAAGYNNYFDGLIDEVRIYNRALSDAEIKALYDATK